MPLALTLKSKERMIIGNAVVSNTGRHAARLVIETEVPILRERDILPPDRVTTPCGRIYLALQLMYVEPAKSLEYQQMFLDLTGEVCSAAPSLRPLIGEIGDSVMRGEYYQALLTGKRLLLREEELLSTAAAAPTS